jgi:transcription elongation GreA/GreB family factor
VKKSILRDAIVAQLRAELALQTRAAWLARDEATNEESRAENKYDTRGQEAAYLAEGQARIAAEIEESIAQYATLTLPDFPAGTAIALGALVELISATKGTWYFLGPRAGGMELRISDRDVLVVTPQSPLGRQLLGKHVGDMIAMPGRTAGSPSRVATLA